MGRREAGRGRDARRKKAVWACAFALLWGVLSWPGVAKSSACGEAQELFLLGVSLGQPCAGECLKKKVALYAKAVRLCPQYPEAHNNLADAYEKLGRFAEAETRYRQALRINPWFAVPYFGLGDLYLRQGKVAEAVEMYTQGLERDPEDGLSLRRLAGAKALLREGRAGKTEEARILLESSAGSLFPPRRRQRFIVRVLFDTDSATLSEEAVRQVEALGQMAVQAGPGVAFIMEGHADRRGSRPYNRRLSRGRAEAVQRYLARHFGIALARLPIQVLGEKKPVALGDGEGAWAMNRRVEVVQVRRGKVSRSEK